MQNLLNETIEILEKWGKNESDVKWVGNETHKTTWDNLLKINGIN